MCSSDLIYKTFEDLFLSQEERDNRILEEIQSEDLCKIRSDAGDKKTSGVDAEKKLDEVYGKSRPTMAFSTPRPFTTTSRSK